LNPRRITVFTGHYGSGKSNIAVNYALYLKEHHGKKVIIGDLDIVNPYFRTKDSAKRLEGSDIRLISSRFANTNIDVPAVSGEMNVLFDDRDAYGVIDLGGDDRGALALGRYHTRMLEDETNVWIVINMFRPLSRDVEHTLAIMEEIERAARIRCNGIVNNSNLGSATTPQDVLDSLHYAQQMAEVTGLPLVMTTVRRDLADSLQKHINNLFPIDLEEQQWQSKQK
jgi:energy-coupling factor transporter ATP-binding protein EcfA2